MEPVKWSTEATQISETEWDLIFTADIDNGWYVYSQFLDEGGPIPTTIHYDTDKGYSLIGQSEESGHEKSGHDAMFDMDVTKFSDNMMIVQRISIEEGLSTLSGQLEYMTCDDARCLPPTIVEFSFNLDSEPSLTTDESSLSDTEDDIKIPAKWTGKYTQLDNGQIELTFTGSIDEGWYVYSRNLRDDAGPVPATITYESEDLRIIEEKESGPNIKTEHDEIFETEVTKVFDEMVLTDIISIPANTKSIKGILEYMSCSNTECVFPPPVSFVIDVEKQMLTIIDANGSDSDLTASSKESQGALMAYYNLDPTIMDDTDIENCSYSQGSNDEPLSKSGNGKIFFLGFIGGLIALLTPCVFPMIPLTVSYFTKTNSSKAVGIQRATMYGGFIFLIYLLLSLPFHFIDSINPDILNNISTNVVLNIVFFIVFILFAFSFFGYYELTLPSSWSNKVSQAEGIGGGVGIFFMALTLALVSFSCTGPILGSLLAGSLSSNGGAMQLTAGMSGFGLALALPFGLFAAFPAVLAKLPKSGSWMTTVKVIMGFLELALAFKFLSNADLVKHWGLLKIEIFLVIWIVLAIGLALYLLGVFRFPHDAKVANVGRPRKILGILSLVIAAYLLSGFRYNENTQTFTSLKLLSGIAPPVGYSLLHPNECPNNINCFKDLEAGMKYAKENNLPVMLDFTGYACVNCRKMEEHVWPDAKITSILQDEFVLISLYVDDRTPLTEEEMVSLPKHNGGERTLKTVGDKWQFFQTEFFKNNSQPFYVLMDNEGQLLNKPVGYTPAIDEFQYFLECGLQNHQSKVPSLGLQ
ncbi:thioredoxin family protein [Membranihabitans marinus]